MLSAGLVGSLAVLVAGCGNPSEPAPGVTGDATATSAESGHNLDGWWCAEHGVPEEECSMCSAEVAEKLKAKGDWCQEHDRADTQCFICHPELAEKFATRFEAKFGKKPPKPTE
jgi:hypothetical protein